MSAPSRAGVSGHPSTTRPTRWSTHRPGVVRHPARTVGLALGAALLALVAACGGTSPVAQQAGEQAGATAAPAGDDATLTIGAIPDQDTDKLQEIYGTTADYLSEQLGIPVEFRPVTDYAAAVSQFRTGDLDLVWFGGLTGVQARLQTPGAVPLVQRDIDDDFSTVFIGHVPDEGEDAATALQPIDDVAGLSGLSELAGTRFTFGSQSSTSGYLMPAYYLLQAGVDPQTGFAGRPGFSGSHDKTIDLVEAGSYQAGAVNEQVWDSRVEAGTVDTSAVRALWRTPAYHDYHWVLGPSAVEDFGDDLPRRITEAFTRLSPDDPDEARLLDLFGAGAFIPTEAGDYDQIEEVGRRLGLVSGS